MRPGRSHSASTAARAAPGDAHPRGNRSWGPPYSPPFQLTLFLADYSLTAVWVLLLGLAGAPPASARARMRAVGATDSRPLRNAPGFVLSVVATSRLHSKVE